MAAIVGGLLVLAGLALAARSALLLVGRGRPRRGPTPRFIIAGPYRRMRNPLFAGMLLVLAGLAVAAQSVPLGVAAVATAAAMHLWVTFVEEPRLARRFGDAYAAYLAAVPRWLPVRPRQAPAADPDP
ncbi:MAG TPA: methyltransferase [Candidatus Limnocylindria bacterium]|nr:methyltransferase [Candidatus Limnocylindria bacterium]